MKKISRVALAASSIVLFATMSSGPAFADHGDIIIDEDGNAVSGHPPVGDSSPSPAPTEEIVISPAPPTEPAPAPEAPTEPAPEVPGDGGTIPGDGDEPAPTEPAPAPTPAPPAPAPRDPGSAPTPVDGTPGCTEDAAGRVICDGGRVVAGAPCLQPGVPIPAELIAKGITEKDIKRCKVHGKPAPTPTPDVVPEISIVVNEETKPNPVKKTQPLIETGVVKQSDNSPSSLFMVFGLLGIAAGGAVAVAATRSRKATVSTEA